jgi:nicotinic acid mononucleotide adenylyltransferase
MSASDSVPTTITHINYLFPGSFSPVTVSHIGAVKKLLAGEGLTKNERDIKPPPKITVYIIPVSDRYPKDSVKPGTSVYLSEKTRKEFLETAVKPLVEKGGSVIVSDAEFEYGKGRIQGVEPGKAPSTSFLVENYNQPVRTNGETYLEHPENFGGKTREHATTYLILGADNAYVDMVGWADPKAILANIKILVIARGDPPSPEDKAMKLVKCYYSTAAQSPQLYSKVVEERNATYGNRYDLEEKIKENITQLDFTVAEASSSLIRSLISFPDQVSLENGADGKPCELEKVLTELRQNDKSIPELAAYSMDMDGKKKINPDFLGILVAALTPISLDTLKTQYGLDYDEGVELKKKEDAAAAKKAQEDAAAAASNPGGGARSKKTKRRKGVKGGRRSKTRKRRLTNKRRGNRRRNRTHH